MKKKQLWKLQKYYYMRNSRNCNPVRWTGISHAWPVYKIPQGSTKDVSHQKYKKLEDRLENHEQLSESILSTLQRIEGIICEIPSLKEATKQIPTEKDIIKNQTDSLEIRYNEINVNLY